MARSTRKTAVQFGGSAGTNQIAEFGSLAAGTPVYSTDPAVIQSLTQFATGWFAAVIGGNSPAIEDMNALFFVLFYQVFYLLQAGVPEWDTGTTYFTGDITQDGGGVLYVSQADNNAANALSTTAKWATMPLVTTQPFGAARTIASGISQLFSGPMTIASGVTWTVTGTLNSVGAIIVSGTLIVGSGGVARSL